MMKEVKVDTEPSTTEENKNSLVENGNESESESDIESDNETDDENKSNIISKFPKLSFVDGTEQYVITENDVPKFYSHNINNARKWMWYFARMRRIREYNYNCYIREGPNMNSVKVIGTYKFYSIAYDKTICHFKVCKIHEIKETIDLGQNEENSHRTGFIASIFG